MHSRTTLLLLALTAAAPGASLLTLSNPVSNGSIITTGGNNDRSDWTGTTAFPTDANESNPVDYASITVAHDDSNFYIRQQTYQTDAGGFLSFGEKLIIDTDRSRGTGYRGPNDAFAVGGEYMLEGATLYLYVGTGTDWNWQWVGGVSFDDFPLNDHEMSFAKTAIGSPGSFDFIAITDFFGGGDAYPDSAHGGASGGSYTYTTVPEPGVALLGGLGLLTLLRRRI